MLYDDRGGTITVTRELAHGGEGRICTIKGDETVLLKLLDHPTHEHAAKIAAMIENRPRDTVTAWPLRTVRGERREHLGHVMPWIKDGVHVSQVYNPNSRRTIAPGFTYEYLVCAAINIAQTTSGLHRAGYVIGDVGDANFLVHRNGTVTLIDTDSIQVPRPDHRGYFRCAVGTDEYTPPELCGINFSVVDRSVHHDNFGLAVLLFRTLMEGTHPHASKYTGPGEPPNLNEKIQRGIWPYNGQSQFQPPTGAPPLNILPTAIQELFRRAFTLGHRQPTARPSAAEWQGALTQLHHNLKRCTQNSLHSFSNHLSRCPWCERATRLGTPQPPSASPHVLRQSQPPTRLAASPLLRTTTLATPSLRPTLQPLHTLRGTTYNTPGYRPDPSAALNNANTETLLTIRNSMVTVFQNLAECPNLPAEMRAQNLFLAQNLVQIERNNEFSVIATILAGQKRKLQDPTLPPGERESILDHIRTLEQRLLTI